MKSGTVYAELVGGLGNQLFQFAAGYSLAHKNNSSLVLDISPFKKYKRHSLSLFNFNIKTQARKLKKIKFWKLDGIINPIKIYREPHFHFDKQFTHLKPTICLTGYWQSYKYFESIESKIKEILIPKELNPSIKKYLELAKKASITSIHIRRGDYITDPNARKIHPLCSNEYYQEALSLISKETEGYFLFSDDPVEAKKQFGHLKNIYFISENNYKDSEELFLMSRCKNNIIANSTFSWWAAWLNDSAHKKIFYPHRWFNNDLNTTDLFPPEWTCV